MRLLRVCSARPGVDSACCADSHDLQAHVLHVKRHAARGLASSGGDGRGVVVSDVVRGRANGSLPYLTHTTPQPEHQDIFQDAFTRYHGGIYSVIMESRRL